MKNLLALLLVTALLITLCACSSKNPTQELPNSQMDNPSHQSDKQLPDCSPDSPAQSLIQSEVENALSVLPNAVLTNLTTIKSQTTDTRYIATFQVSAATTYADWQMECDVTYTKYDQGWMFDEIDWKSKEYVIARIPDVDTLSEIANNTEVSIYYRDTLPVENATIDVSNVEDVGVIGLHWTKIYDYMHATCIGEYTTMWDYDPETDNWFFLPSDSDFGFFRQETVIPDPVDFTGNWDGIEISNFTWDSFDVKCGNIDSHFYKISGPPYNDEIAYGWYADGSGKYFQISCGPSGTGLSIRSFGHVMTQYAFTVVEVDLPSL